MKLQNKLGATIRKAVRAIIIKEGQLLIMHRNKFGQEYDTLPGGNIEVGETPEQALYRELEEETMVTFSINKMCKNLYEPMWVNLAELQTRPFLSAELKKFILQSVNDDWPASAVEITTN